MRHSGSHIALNTTWRDTSDLTFFFQFSFIAWKNHFFFFAFLKEFGTSHLSKICKFLSWQGERSHFSFCVFVGILEPLCVHYFFLIRWLIPCCAVGRAKRIYISKAAPLFQGFAVNYMVWKAALHKQLPTQRAMPHLLTFPSSRCVTNITWVQPAMVGSSEVSVLLPFLPYLDFQSMRFQLWTRCPG